MGFNSGFKGLTCWWSLASCFRANRRMTAVTISMLRSLWKSVSLIYQGAFTVSLSTLFWKRWMFLRSLLFKWTLQTCWLSHSGVNFTATAAVCLGTPVDRRAASLQCIGRLLAKHTVAKCFMCLSQLDVTTNRACGRRGLNCIHGTFRTFWTGKAA